MKKCKYCKKIIFDYQIYCNRKCRFKFEKKYKIGFWNSELQIKRGKQGAKIANKLHKINKTSFYNSELQTELSKRANISNKKNKTGFWDKRIQSMGGRKGILKALRIIRNLRGKHYNLKFNRIYFMSKVELEIALCIHYQLEKLKEDINFQKRIDTKFFDFYLKNLDCFIEVHYANYFNNKETLFEYYNRRRQLLNENGYKYSNLVILP